MANTFDQITDMIKKIVLEVTRYNVPRIGKVSKIIDSFKKGRILVTIPILGWDTDDIGAWCYPKDKKGIITPSVGDYVLVEFIDGNKELPVYSGIASQMKDMLPGNYDGENSTQILFENRNKEEYFKYDEITKILSMLFTEIDLNGNSKSFVTYGELNTALQLLITALNSHIHIDPISGTTGTPVTPVSLDISASETSTIKTGG